MSKLYILTDATLFIDGVGTFGTATSVEVPAIKPIKTDHNPIDGVGTQKLPNGKVEIDTFKATLNCFYPDVFTSIANPFKSVLIQVYGNLMGFTNGSQDGNEQALLTMKCSASEYKALCDKKEQDASNWDLTFDPSSVYLRFNNKELIDVDFDNNQYIVNGADIRADILKNLGIT